MMFIDEARVNVVAGNGGAGCRSFRREAHVPKGGPDGGDGGHGGDVILRADQSISTLLDYHFHRHFKAQRGTHGQGAACHGADGDPLVLPVPVGTLVRDMETGDVIADLVHHDQKVVVARGGRGGRGNRRFVTATRRAPAFAELGEPAEERWIDLELKLLADAALVGFPSAGKSSLIARMSAARPKIADYPFTTLVPNLGVVSVGDRSFVVADVPGLIEGASEGIGLGHAFLRHIERTSLILHVVDLTGSYEQRDPVSDLQVINAELAAHADELADRPQIVIGNKIDVPGTEEASERLAAFCEEQERPYFAVSAATGQGMDSLLRAVAERVHELRAASAVQEPAYEGIYVYEPPTEHTITVERTGAHSYVVHGGSVERMVIMTEMDNDEAVAHLQHRLARAGVETALTAAGAEDGDTVSLGAVSFEFEAVGGGEPDDE